MPNTTSADWDESSPVITEPRRDGALEINTLREGVGDRIAKEHVHPAAADVGGEHLEGSARAYNQDDEPTKRPDGTTNLNIDDDGRLWADLDDATDRKLFIWNGATLAWEEISKQAAVPFTQEDLAHDGTPTDIAAAFDSTAGYENEGTFAELINWNIKYEPFGSIGPHVNVEYKKSGGAFVAFADHVILEDTGDQDSILIGSYILNPGDFMRITQQAQAPTYIVKQVWRTRFTM